VRERLKCHIILRTSCVFSAHGQNSSSRYCGLQMPSRNYRSPLIRSEGLLRRTTSPRQYSTLSRSLPRPISASGGTYHFSGTPAVSWFEFAKAIVADTNATVLPISTEDYPLPARRPLNSVLSRIFGIAQPDWRVALRSVLKELGVQWR
jgi:dTDP-4-dehydrorhamnose reductase